MKKRILALSLALLMVVSILPVQGFANDESTGSDVVIVDQPAPETCPDCGSTEHTVHPAADPAPETCPDCGSDEHTVHPAPLADDPAPQVCETCGNEPCTCGTPAPQADPCDKCGKTPCECPTACETCGKTPCECPTTCEDCGKTPCECDETHVTLVEQLLGAISLAHFRELFYAEANQAAVQALTKEEITSLIAKVEALYNELEAPLESDTTTRDALIAALKALPAMACPECGKFEGHAEGCTNIPMMSPQPPRNPGR